MPMRYIALFLLLTIGLYADTLRIIGAVPFGSSSLRLEANRTIHHKDISLHKLNDTTTFLDVYGIWVPINRKEYNFPNQTQIVVAQNNKQRLRVLATLTNKTEFTYFLKNKFIYITIKEKETKRNIVPIHDSKKPHNIAPHTLKESASPTQKVASPPPPTKSLTNKKDGSKPVRISRLQTKKNKIIMIDPGHGGKDCGARGVTQICEKAIVLSVAQLTAKELVKRGYVVYMTRNSDIFIELQRRTEMANEIHADLFISIHANSMPVGSTRQPKGVETYFLSTARTERAVNVAANENQGVVEYSPTTIASFLTSQRIIASNKLAMDIQSGILKQVRTKYNENLDGGVREGPFWVLVGALMPSVLVEIGYNSNPIESKRLNDPQYQALLANGIANGIEGYISKNP